MKPAFQADAALLAGMAATPMHAVVLDANRHDRVATIDSCRRLGIEVDGWAETATAGLDLLEGLARTPELTLIDLHYSDMDAADLIQALALLATRTSVVVCSRAEPRLADAACQLAQALGLSVLCALPKPLQSDALRRALALRPPPPWLPEQAPAAPLVFDAADLLRGLRRREFELHYQPKFDVADLRVRGAEALLRWRHPVHGLLAAGRFLPQVRAAALLDPLTLEVLHLALADRRAHELRLPLSLNLSAELLTNPHLAARLIDTVHTAGVAPGALTFEVTEDAELLDIAAALRVLIKLRLHGFGLSLDDYGAGFASLLRLSCLPCTELKIDRALVHDAWARPHLLPLLRSAIGLAGELGIEAVAEGVETAADFDVLRSLGCHQVQGYHLARPMPAADLARLARDNRLRNAR